MNSDILYINEKRADITGINISENIQVNDFFEINGRQSSFTNTIRLPKTEINKKIFEGLGIATNLSKSPYRYQKFTFLRNGIEMFANAIGIIRETNDFYNVNIYYNNNNLFEAIDKEKLSDLNLDNLNHDLNEDEFINRLNDEQLIYALADYGVQTDNVIVYDYQIPAIRVKLLWDKIFAEAGFNYVYKGRGSRNDYNPFTDDLFTKSYITLTNGLKEKNNLVEPLNVLQATRLLNPDFSEFSFTNVFGTFWNVPYSVTRPINFQSNFIESDFIIQNITSQNTFYQFQQSGYYKLNISGEFIGSSIQEVVLRIKSGGVNIYQSETFEAGVNEFTFEERFYFQEGQIITFDLEATNENSSLPLVYSYDFDLNIDSDNQFARVNLNQNFSNITKRDFIKDICNYFGLTFVNKGNVYEFMTYQELLTPFTNYVNFNAFTPVNYVFDDWSHKFSRLIKESYKIGDYARENKFAYLYDEEAFADGVINIDDETLDFDRTLITRIFKATDSSSISVSNNQLNRMLLYELDGEKIKAKKTQPYIFIPKKVNGSFSYKQEGGSVETYTGEFNIAKFTGLSWQNSLTKYNNGLNNVLQRQNKIEAEIELDEYDVANIDFFKLKYIKQLGAMFYLNKIVNFQNETTTKVELIKVETTEQLGAFSDAFSDAFDN